MKEQPTALRLADLWEKHSHGDARTPEARTAAELRRLHQHEFVNEIWHVKTQWVQDTAKPEELGMHRADVMRQRLERITAQRDALLEALREYRAAILFAQDKQALMSAIKSADDKALAAIAKAEGA